MVRFIFSLSCAPFQRQEAEDAEVEEICLHWVASAYVGPPLATEEQSARPFGSETSDKSQHRGLSSTLLRNNPAKATSNLKEPWEAAACVRMSLSEKNKNTRLYTKPQCTEHKRSA